MPRLLIALVILVLAAVIMMDRPAAAQCPAPGNCLTPHGTPGCDSAECCIAVCGFAGQCCDTVWDAFCAALADELCIGLCGASVSGDCFSPHGNPSCDTFECCSAVCAIDPFCCATEWDTACAVFAGQFCRSTPGTCGDPGAGNCFESHPGSACSDLNCCLAVCSVDPTCCESAWDFICVVVAEAACSEFCQLECPPFTLQELEACNAFINDPCIFPTPGAAPVSIACNTKVCGRISDDGTAPNPDVDIYQFLLSDPDGDGLAEVTLRFQSQFLGFAALISVPCGPLEDSPLVVESVNCLLGQGSVCVPPGLWRVAVTSGFFPEPGNGQTDCDFNGAYIIEIRCDDNCAAACGPDSGSCFTSHATPGCNDIACCEAVCEIDPFCCASDWDASCASSAIVVCGGTPPANDDCGEALDLIVGTTPFSTIGATVDGPPLPPSCDEGSGIGFGPDIWFTWTATCDAPVTIDTCADADFDTRLALYTNECDALFLQQCNDDAVLCLISTRSQVIFEAECGVTYILRVGGFNNGFGSGVLTLSCGFGPACPSPCSADLTGDGIVNGADLGELLANWGNPGVGDLDGSGEVDGADLGELLAAWGAC